MRPPLSTAGHCCVSPHAAALIEGFAAQVLIADRGYDSDTSTEAVTAEGVHSVIPPRSNCLEQRGYDRNLDHEHHLIECFINKYTHDRRVFSRVGKPVKNYGGFLSFVSTLMGIREMQTEPN